MDDQGLKKYLMEHGATEVGYANLSELEKGPMKLGVAIYVKILKEVIASIDDGPNMGYYQAYHALNEQLNRLAELASTYLRALGYEAYAQTTAVVEEYGNYRTKLPHKTVATLAGLGWIGKSALFVTRSHGSALRLTSVVTDMPLNYGEAICESQCGSCSKCVEACPGEAMAGTLWRPDVDRDFFFDVVKCRTKARALSQERLQKEITLCGKCIEVCPYTQKYINS